MVMRDKLLGLRLLHGHQTSDIGHGSLPDAAHIEQVVDGLEGAV